MQNNKLGVDALVAAGIVAVTGVKRTIKDFSDGFQAKDLASFIRTFGEVEEVIKNREAIVAEIQDLEPGEITDFVFRVAQGANLPEGSVTVRQILEAFVLLDRTYSYVVAAIDLVKGWSEWVAETRAIINEKPTPAPIAV